MFCLLIMLLYYCLNVVLIQESSVNNMLRHDEIQRCIDDVNLQVADEHNRQYGIHTHTWLLV